MWPKTNRSLATAIGKKRGQTLEMVSAEGVPSKSVMISNWWTTFFPGNNGFPVSISPNIHPMLQMSIAGVYCNKCYELEVQYKIS